MGTPKKHNPHFFNREGPDNTVRIRLKLRNEEASLYEEAAGDTPIMLWIHRTLEAAGPRQIAAQRRKRPAVGPPEEE